MGKYENLTKYLMQLSTDEIGAWVIKKTSDSSLEHPMQMPYVDYSEVVRHFMDDFYKFSEEHPEFRLNRYGETLEENGISWGTESMSNVDVTALDENCILALIMGAIRAERFCDGALLSFFKKGTIVNWLERLKELDY